LDLTVSISFAASAGRLSATVCALSRYSQDMTMTSTETPRDKFLRLAPSRTEKALKSIKLLSNLTSHGYQYEPEEAQQILDALFDAVHDLKRRFDKSKAAKAGFTFQSKKAEKAV
jgi:hypothetical protein